MIRLLTALLLVCLTISAQAQLFSIPKYMQRMHIGYTYILNTAKYDGEISTFGLNTTNPDSATFFTPGKTTQNLTTKGGYGIAMGTFFPLTNFGGQSVGLALTTDFVYNFMLWEKLKGGYYDQADFDILNASGVTLQVGLPIGLDLKFGGEATTSKANRLTASVGAGINPMYSLTSYEDNAGTVFSPSPYIKLEGGIRAGIIMKLRLLYTIGTPEYISKDGALFGTNDEYTTSFTLTGKSSINLSLLLMPFSSMWEENGWWNRH